MEHTISLAVYVKQTPNYFICQWKSNDCLPEGKLVHLKLGRRLTELSEWGQSETGIKRNLNLGPRGYQEHTFEANNGTYCLRKRIEKFLLELFLSKVNNRETIVVIEANNDTYCLQK